MAKTSVQHMKRDLDLPTYNGLKFIGLIAQILQWDIYLVVNLNHIDDLFYFAKFKGHETYYSVLLHICNA